MSGAVEDVRARAVEVKARAEDVRRRSPFVDRSISAVEQFGAAQASQHAGAVTYFGLLSFFPILAIAFFAVGWISKAYPEAQSDLLSVLEDVLPGIFGNGSNQIPLETVEAVGSTVGWIGALVLLYSGLGWLSAMRKAIAACFGETKAEQPGFVVGKVRDLLSLAVLGVVLLLSVSASSPLRAFGSDVLDLLGLSSDLGWALTAFTWAFGLLTSVLLFWALFRVLARTQLPARALWQGALLGALSFEALKWLSGALLAATKSQPAFQAFGIALILLVWINWFARVTLFAACWAYTAPVAAAERAARAAEVEAQDEGLGQGAYASGPPPGTRAKDEPWTPEAAFAVGAATMLGLVAVLQRVGRR
jgi:membrane protein